MLDYFANDKYKVLECMFQRQIAVNGENVVKLSQQEIASMQQSTVSIHRCRIFTNVWTNLFGNGIDKYC